MSTQKIYAAIIESAKHGLPSTATPGGVRHLDIGAGRGELIGELRCHFPLIPSACDLHVDRFRGDNVTCVTVDLNHERLPYPDAQFDLVTCSEVVEHLENYRALLRDAFRVTANGGLLVLTTPNVLNLKSRVRYMVSGFPNLFGPLPLANDRRSSTRTHISSIPYFYLAHALLEAGFDRVQLRIDKVQKASVCWLILLVPFIFAGRRHFMMQERQKYKTLTEDNDLLVAAHFSWPLLVGRTIVVSAVKPGDATPMSQRDAPQAACP